GDRYCRAVRRIVAHCQADLREDRLENPAMEQSEAAAQHGFSLSAGELSEQALVPDRRVGEAKAWLHVVVGGVAEVDQMIYFARPANALEPRAELESKGRRHSPRILRVETCFRAAVAVLLRAEALLIGLHDALHEVLVRVVGPCRRELP